MKTMKSIVLMAQTNDDPQGCQLFRPSVTSTISSSISMTSTPNITIKSMIEHSSPIYASGSTLYQVLSSLSLVFPLD